MPDGMPEHAVLRSSPHRVGDRLRKAWMVRRGDAGI